MRLKERISSSFHLGYSRCLWLLTLSLLVSGCENHTWVVKDYRSGRPGQRIRYVNGLLEGASLHFYDQPGMPCKSLHRYLNGKLNGRAESFSPNGKLILSTAYLKGELHGPSTKWSENGALVYYEEYEFGLRHGVTRNYGNDGYLLSETHYYRGNYQGWKRTFAKGELVNETWYEQNIPSTQ